MNHNPPFNHIYQHLFPASYLPSRLIGYEARFRKPKVYQSRLIYDGADESLGQLYQNAISKLLSALLGEDVAYNLRSRVSNGDMVSNLAHLVERLRKAQENFKYDDYRPLVNLVIQRPPTESQNAETWNFDVWKAVFTLIDTIPRRTTPPASVPPPLTAHQ
ncbi:hypothetical protein ACJ73_09801 [Blastomyces percursus]|uniref:Uncharacterized protein n=1 Tax=Blastomyces percursus TaxID=1658174 RepID=A0A1J9P0T0_9EURO|nr:hypothetical protein ACJ73_09801 [Blastomyces percursus]